MATFLHGVETVETVSGPVPVNEIASSIIAVFGTSDLAAPKQMVLTRTLDEAKVAYGAGSILETLRRVHTYYTPYNTVIGVPLGKDADFQTPDGKGPSGVILGSSTVKAFIDDGAGLPVVMHNPNGLGLAWAVDDEAVATIDAATGVLTPLTAGEVAITLTVTGNDFFEGDTLTCTVTVAQTNPNAGKTATGAALTSSVQTAYLGSVLALMVVGSQGLPVVWRSSNPAIATVDATGLVTPVKEGTAQLTAELAGDATWAPVTLTCTLTVAKPSDALLAAFIEAVPMLLKARTKFGFNPKIGLAPGIMHKPGASGAVLPVARKLRMTWLADVPAGVSTPEAARLAKQAMSDERIFCLWPRPKVLDADAAATVAWAAPSWAGLIAQVDKDLAGIQGGSGYWCSPSNLKLGDVVGTEHELEFIINERDTPVNYLNANGIATLINYGGWLAFGNRSTAFPDKTDPMTFLCWRRTADVIEESIEYFVMQFLDRPMFTRPDQLQSTLLGRVQDSVNDFLRSKIGSALIDGKCWIEVSANPLANLAQGIIRFKYRFTPPMVTEHIMMDAEIYVQGLEEAFKKLVGGN
ncbi:MULTISPECIES: Ig-like domain-containing protein [Aeromonas]|uniref:Ig-like domain-containing protein n=1 Tax=Aeromonas TaxID=642 RepID=UPI000CDD1A8A|nr:MULTISPECIES: Ig-like domain-containing protein [Aeromonas]AUZ76231.1 phage tail protein [Aeromonas sp. ASNIH4]POU36277.1 phage tail protein [Aeromonas hydrophila]POV85924.1 phage tail protein [Aeromonas sp. ASNIH6]